VLERFAVIERLVAEEHAIFSVIGRIATVAQDQPGTAAKCYATTAFQWQARLRSARSSTMFNSPQPGTIRPRFEKSAITRAM